MGKYSGTARAAAYAAFSSTFFICNFANAATLTVVSNKVFVSKGGGYAQVHGQTELGPTDCVLVNPGGSAQISYEDGSVTKIDPGMSLCLGDAAAGGNGGGAAAAAAAAPGGIGASALVVGGLAVAGGVGLITAVSSNNDSAPASP